MAKGKLPRSAEEVEKEKAIEEITPEPTTVIKGKLPQKQVTKVEEVSPPAKAKIQPATPVQKKPTIKAVAPKKEVVIKEEPKVESSKPLTKKKTASPKPSSKRVVKRSASDMQKSSESITPIRRASVIPTKTETKKEETKKEEEQRVYTLNEEAISKLVGSIVEGLSANFVTKDEATKVVIGTLQKIATKDIKEDEVEEKLNTPSVEIEEDNTNDNEENDKKEGFFSRLFKKNNKGT